MSIHNLIRASAVLLLCVGVLLTAVGGLMYRPYASTLPFAHLVASAAYWKIGISLITPAIVLFCVSIIRDPDV
jgi:hypothetical protein